MKAWRWLICAFVILQALAAAGAGNWPVYAQSTSPPVTEYWQLIQETLEAIRQARKLPPEQRGPVLADAADKLEAVSSVTLPNGQIAPVDNTALVAGLRVNSPDLEKLELRLDALAWTHRTWRQPSSDPAAFDKLALVLARPEFQPRPQRQPSWFDQWWEKFINWIDELLTRLMFSRGANALGLDWIVLIIGALVLAGVAFFFWRNVRAHLVREAALAQDAAELNGLSASSAIKQAQTLAAGANYRQAVRYLYLAALLTLDERGVLRYDKTLTNRQVLRHARQSADTELAQAMSPVVDTFDSVWYGFTEVDDETYQTYAKQISQVTNAKPSVKRDE